MSTLILSENNSTIKPKTNVKRYFGGGWRRPIIDEYGNKWCNCDFPKLISNSYDPGAKGQAYCTRCKCYWYH